MNMEHDNELNFNLTGYDPNNYDYNYNQDIHENTIESAVIGVSYEEPHRNYNNNNYNYHNHNTPRDGYDGDKYSKIGLNRHVRLRGYDTSETGYCLGYIPWNICYLLLLITFVGSISFFIVSIAFTSDPSLTSPLLSNITSPLETNDDDDDTSYNINHNKQREVNVLDDSKTQHPTENTEIQIRNGGQNTHKSETHLTENKCPPGQSYFRGECARMLYHPNPLDKTMMANVSDPCNDFYSYACGSYVEDIRNVGTDSTFSYIYKENMKEVVSIITRAPKDSKLEMFYTTCLTDESNTSYLSVIDDITTNVNTGDTGNIVMNLITLVKDQLHDISSMSTIMGQLLKYDILLPFRFSMELDPAHARRAIPTFIRSGLSDTSDTIKLKIHKDAVKMRLIHIMSEQEANKGAEIVTDIENRLASIFPSKEDEDIGMFQYVDDMKRKRRNIVSYQKFMEIIYPLNIDSFIQSFVGDDRYNGKETRWHLDHREDIWILNERYFESLSKLFSELPIESWRYYFLHSILFSVMDLTPKSDPELFYTYHHGYDPEHTLPWNRPPRFIATEFLAWDRQTRCTQITAAYLPILIDNYFVNEKNIGIKDRSQVKKVGESVKHELSNYLLSRGNRKAEEKVDNIEVMAGTPNNWPMDRSDLRIGRNLHVENILNIRKYHQELMMDTMYPGKTLSADDLFDGPLYIANAYYQHQLNAIMINAGILLPPAFSSLYDEVSQFARLGVFIGHELVHSIDIMGTFFDKEGSYNPWMNYNEEVAYVNRAQCVVDLYNKKTRYGNMHNGEKTINENIADIIGFKSSYNSLFNGKKRNKWTINDKKQFFLVYGQTWCKATTKKDEYDFIEMSVHSTPEMRVNNVVWQQDEFNTVFQCNPNTKAKSIKKCNLF